MRAGGRVGLDMDTENGKWTNTVNSLHFLLVRTAGVEPARGLPLRILSPVCLPVPPHPQFAGDGARNPGLTKRHPCPRNTSARVAKRYPRVTANLDNSN